MGSIWILPGKHLLNISGSGCWTRQDQARWARSPRQKCGCCACRVTFPHFQPDFHAAPALFSKLCLPHAAPKAVPGPPGIRTLRLCPQNLSFSISVCSPACAGRAGEAALKLSCVCSLTGAVSWAQPGCPGHPARGTSAAPGDALSLGRPSLSPLSARSPWCPRRFTGGEDTKAIDLRQRFPPGRRSHGNHSEHPRGRCGPINHGRLPPGTGRPLLSPQPFRSVLGENSTLCPWSWSALERIFPSRWCVRGGRAGTETPVSPALPPHTKTQLRNPQPV